MTEVAGRPDHSGVARLPKPETAAWIQRERKRLGLPVAGLRERLALYGVTVGEQTIRVWEGNNPRPPGPAAVDALERIFGTTAPNRKTPALEGEGLAQAINALVDELRSMREERESIEARLAGLEGVVSLLAERAGVEPQVLGAPPVEAGSGR